MTLIFILCKNNLISVAYNEIYNSNIVAIIKSKKSRMDQELWVIENEIEVQRNLR